MLCRTRRQERPILSSPANRIGGRNKTPTSFDAVASPIAAPAKAANPQLRVSAHRHPRYRARVEKKARKISKIASRPKTRVRGEITHSASARAPVQYPATRQAKANRTRPVRRAALAAGIRTASGSEEL